MQYLTIEEFSYLVSTIEGVEARYIDQHFVGFTSTGWPLFSDEKTAAAISKDGKAVFVNRNKLNNTSGWAPNSFDIKRFRNVNFEK